MITPGAGVRPSFLKTVPLIFSLGSKLAKSGNVSIAFNCFVPYSYMASQPSHPPPTPLRSVEDCAWIEVARTNITIVAVSFILPENYNNEKRDGKPLIPLHIYLTELNE